MKINWSHIYKRYLFKAKGNSFIAYNEMMHDYWNGAIPGVPRGRYGEVPHGESFRRLVSELDALRLAAYVVAGEPEEPKHTVETWLGFWILILILSCVCEVISLTVENHIFVLVCLSVMVSSLAMCTFLGIKKAEVK
jgi:hypothetical protein